jgi:hypothetical protein
MVVDLLEGLSFIQIDPRVVPENVDWDTGSFSLIRDESSNQG